MGFAYTSLQFAKFSEADEMWTVNFAWRYEVPRIDRLFEIHPIELLAYNAFQGDTSNKDYQHFKWLQEEHDFTIYTHADYTGDNVLDSLGDILDNRLAEGEISEEGYQKYKLKYADIIKAPPRMPRSVPYQWDIIDPIFENLSRENKPGQIYMPSTISYMIALAIHEGFERIEMYGVEMAANSGGANGTEYVYQKAGAEGLLMYAMGKGIEVYLPENCKLMNIKPYHKGLQMITRQTLESLKKQYEQNRVNAQSKTNHFRGQLTAAEQKWVKRRKNIQHNWGVDKVKAGKNGVEKAELFNINAGYEKKLQDLVEAGEKEIGPLIKSVSYHQGMAIMADGNVQLCSALIDSIDLDDPIVNLVNRFSETDIELINEKKEKVLA